MRGSSPSEVNRRTGVFREQCFCPDKVFLNTVLILSITSFSSTCSLAYTMSSTKARLRSQIWRKDPFIISTNPAHFPISKLISVYDSEEFYWAKSLPVEAMKEMLENSLSFGMYSQMPSDSPDDNDMIGIARCVTDFATFAYLTDVWVDPAYQGQGLGTWLVRCVHEVLEGMPHLRRTLLFTGDWNRSVPFYQKNMKMELLEVNQGSGLAIMGRRGKGHSKAP